MVALKRVLCPVDLSAVLCPVDFSPAALHAAELAMDVANRANASVTFLHIIEWLAEEDPRGISHFAVPEFRQYLMQNAPLAMLGSTTDQVVCALPVPS